MANKAAAYQLLVLIANPKLADAAEALFLKRNIPVQYRLHAEGTASSEIMDTLGLGSIDKTLLISTVAYEAGNTLLGLLHSQLRLDAVNSGIAFTVPINGVSRLLLHVMRQTAEQVKEERKVAFPMTTDNVLIAVIVNRGFGGDVMDTARAAGAGGGTLVHSRSIGSEEANSVWGLGVQEEKEILLILADSEKKQPIMTAIGEKFGMHSEAAGVVLSLPIDAVTGI